MAYTAMLDNKVTFTILPLLNALPVINVGPWYYQYTLNCNQEVEHMKVEKVVVHLITA